MATTLETAITAQEFVRSAAEVLDRVRERGEHFVVVRDGERVAAIEPVSAAKRAHGGVTLRQFIDLLREAPRPDSKFADDLEAIQCNQPPMAQTQWDSSSTPASS
ncbi:MAG: hypothetical protein HY332_20940 [Chloroflexi bacterium]|nr:hypothetical protein [Chloroflexota bacterium]